MRHLIYTLCSCCRTFLYSSNPRTKLYRSLSSFSGQSRLDLVAEIKPELLVLVGFGADGQVVEVKVAGDGVVAIARGTETVPEQVREISCLAKLMAVQSQPNTEDGKGEYLVSPMKQKGNSICEFEEA